MANYETLDRPITLSRDAKLENRKFKLSANFAWDANKAAIYGSGYGIKIRNVEVIGSESWLTRWDNNNEISTGNPVGIPYGCRGIVLQDVPGVELQDLRVQGFPSHGIFFYGATPGLFRNLKISNCFIGFGSTHTLRSTNVKISKIETFDLWGPNPINDWGYTAYVSLIRPTGYIGSYGMNLESLRSFIIEDCNNHGEQDVSCRLVNPIRGTIRNVRGIGFEILGTSDLTYTIDPTDASKVIVESCLVDKSLGYGKATIEDTNGFQFSQNIQELQVLNCIVKSDDGDGHGIEFVTSVNGTIKGCTIQGWNGVRGVGPAYGFRRDISSSVNADVEQANNFINQQRIATYT